MSEIENTVPVESMISAVAEDAPIILEHTSEGDKTFTQEEVDRIVAGRIQRERRNMSKEREVQPSVSPVVSKEAIQTAIDDDPMAFLETLVTTKVEEKERIRKEQMEAEHAQRVSQKQQEALLKKIDGASTKYKDIKEVIDSVEEWTPAIVQAAQYARSNNAEVLYFLGKNPQELARIKLLSPDDQGREVIKLSERLTSNSTINSSAPAPLKRNTVGGGNNSNLDPNSYAAQKANARAMHERRHSHNRSD